MSIRYKLLIPLIFITCVMLGTMHFFAFSTLRQILVSERVSSERRAVALVALALVPDLLANDLAKIYETLDEVGKQHSWWQALTLTASNGARLYPLAQPGRPPQMTFLSAPLDASGQSLGTLTVEIDEDQLIAPALFVVRELEWLASLILGLGTLTILGVQYYALVRPIKKLAHATLHLSEGKYDGMLPPPSRDEVGELILAFRDMRHAVASRETAIRHNESRLAAVIENSAEAIFSLDEQGRILSFNAAAEMMFALPRSNLSSVTINRLVPFETLKASRGVEVMASRYDTTVFPAFASLNRLSIEGWNMTVINVTDLSRQKEAENRLREARHRYQLILDCAGEGIIGLLPNGKISFANRMAAELLEHTTEEVKGRSFVDLTDASETDRITIAGICVDGGISQWIDADFRRKHSPPLLAEYVVASVPQDNVVMGAVLVFRDVSVRRKYERIRDNQQAELERLVSERTQALQESQLEIIKASRLATVGQLAAGIAHEINTPIQYIGDNLSFVQKSAAKMMAVLADVRTFIGGIEADAKSVSLLKRFDDIKFDFLAAETPPAISHSLEGIAHVSRIVQSMKEFARPGGTEKSMANINREIENTVTISCNAWKLVATLETDLDPNLPLINCHPGELNQAFLNMIINAAQAIESSGKPLPGQITVQTKASDTFIEIRIADNGTGIPDDIKEKIFDPFFTTKDVGQGTGQGLAISHNVVAKLGGHINVESKLGEGSAFTIRLPMA